jgi:membrane protein DedA with SNARE-associated domain
LQYIESFFQKHGSKTVFFGRFFSVLRTYSALFAGISKMPYGEFAVYNATGGIIWALVFGIIGYFFGRNLSYLESILHQVGRSILIVLLVFIFGVLLWRSLIGKERILHRLFSRLLNLPVIVRFLAQGRSFFLWMRRRLTPNE